MKTVTVIQCKECRYFLKGDFWGDSCTFWSNGSGCIVDPEGYCSAAELGKDIAESLEYSLDGGIEEFSREGR